MNSRNPSLLSNSGPPRRAAALPNRPNCIISPSVVASQGDGTAGDRHPNRLMLAGLPLRHALSGPLPAEPVANGIPHHQFLVAPLEPGQLFREHRHALPVRARHAGDIGTPEATLWAERVKDLLDILVDIAVGIRLTRIAWRAREL